MEKEIFDITEDMAKKVLKVVKKGLTSGGGEPVLGQMCVEQAVAFALEYEYNDAPKCVEAEIRSTKITINDMSGIWDTNKQRAKDLKRIAIAQLGSKNVVSKKDFDAGVKKLVFMKYAPRLIQVDIDNGSLDDGQFKDANTALKSLAKGQKPKYAQNYLPTNELRGGDSAGDHIVQLERLRDEIAFNTAIKRKFFRKMMQELIEDIVQLLVELKSPGTKYLDLTE